MKIRTFFLLLITLFSAYSVHASLTLYGTSGHGVYYYDDGDLLRAKGLPRYVSVVRFFAVNRKSVFAITAKHGVFYSQDGGKHWVARRKGLPQIDTSGNFQQLTGFFASKDSMLCAAVTRHRIFLSRDYGNSWYEVKGPSYCSFNSYHYIAITQDRQPVILLPTAFNGFQKGVVRNNGTVVWMRGWYGLPGWSMDRRSFTYETVAAAQRVQGIGYLAVTAFGKGVYRSSNGRRWRKYRFILPKKDNRLIDLRLQQSSLILETDDSLYRYETATEKLQKISYNKYLAAAPNFTGINCIAVLNKGNLILKRFRRPVNRFAKRRLPEAYDRRLRQRIAANKQAIYLNTWLLRNPSRVHSFLSKFRKTKINAVVIDMKDDWGRVVYNSKLPIVAKVGALHPIVRAKELVKAFKKQGIYTVARLVVFKDLRLFRYMQGRYAIKDRFSGKPWIGGHSQKEYWVDPHSRFVWEYNIALAEELVRLGFDEIQFDYIRFPTDGNIYRCKYSHRKKRIPKSAVLAGFLKLARDRVRIPISIDIYGFNGWYVMGNKQGQDISLLCKYVDVICPMYYPSHFGRLFMRQDAYRILFEGTQRSCYFTGSYALIRPYIQAFRMHAPHYGTEYIKSQVRGCYDGGASGYILWNMGGTYQTAYKALPKEGG